MLTCISLVEKIWYHLVFSQCVTVLGVVSGVLTQDLYSKYHVFSIVLYCIIVQWVRIIIWLLIQAVRSLQNITRLMNSRISDLQTFYLVFCFIDHLSLMLGMSYCDHILSVCHPPLSLKDISEITDLKLNLTGVFLEALPNSFKDFHSMLDSGCYGNKDENLERSSCIKTTWLKSLKFGL